MKKKILVVLSFIALLGVMAFALPKANTQAATTKYGIARKFTTPKATRGTWYYREGNEKKIYQLKITKHAVNKNHLYVRSEKYFKKHVYGVNPTKLSKFIKQTENIYAAQKYQRGFNVNNWVNLAGDGNYYLPVTRKVNGKKVHALKLATGAGPYLAAYAYKTKALVKQAK